MAVVMLFALYNAKVVQVFVLLKQKKETRKNIEGEVWKNISCIGTD